MMMKIQEIVFIKIVERNIRYIEFRCMGIIEISSLVIDFKLGGSYDCNTRSVRN